MLRSFIFIALLAMPLMANAQSEAENFVIAGDVASRDMLPLYKAIAADKCKDDSSAKELVCSQRIVGNEDIFKSYITYKIFSNYGSREKMMGFVKCLNEKNKVSAECEISLKEVGEWFSAVPVVIFAENKLNKSLQKFNNIKPAK